MKGTAAANANNLEKRIMWEGVFEALTAYYYPLWLLEESTIPLTLDSRLIKELFSPI